MTSLSTRKPIDQLTPDDLATFAIWEFVSDEENVEGQDETWVRPVPAARVPSDAWSLSVAADFRTPCGSVFPGLVGVTTADGVELGHGAVLAHGKYVPVGSGVLFERARIAAALELALADATPLTFTLRALVDKETAHRTGSFG